MFFVKFQDLGDCSAHVKGFTLVVNPRVWAEATVHEKRAIVAHELRHMWQNVGLLFSSLAIVAILVAIALNSVWGWVVFAAYFRMVYVGVRSFFDVPYSEMDAVRFEWLVARRGAREWVSRWTTPDGEDICGTPWDEDHRVAYEWLRKKVFS